MRPELEAAIRNHNLELLKELISQNPTPENDLIIEDEVNSEHEVSTATIYAAFYGCLEIVRYLVEEKNADASSPILTAISEGHLEIVKYLHEDKSAKFPFHILHNAIQSGNLELVKYLEQKGFDLSKQENCLLKSASHLDIVQYLINEKGANASHADNAVLMTAAGWGRLDTLIYLIKEHNLNVHAQNDAALIRAAKPGHIHVLKYLVEEHNTDIHAQNDKAFIEATKSAQLHAIKYFVEAHNVTPPTHNQDFILAFTSLHPLYSYLISRDASLSKFPHQKSELFENYREIESRFLPYANPLVHRVPPYFKTDINKMNSKYIERRTAIMEMIFCADIAPLDIIVVLVNTILGYDYGAYNFWPLPQPLNFDISTAYEKYMKIFDCQFTSKWLAILEKNSTQEAPLHTRN